MADSLKKKTIKGVGWSAADNVIRFMVTFLVSIVLARLLSPDDYGLLGIVGIFTAICTTLINGGFVSALIRKNDATDDDYNTAFIANLTMSITLYVIIFLCAPLIAAFFNRDELVLLTRVSSFGFVIGSLALVQRTRLTKRIDFKTQTRITFSSSVSSGIISIVLAYMGVGVWALVVQHMLQRIIETVSLWKVNKWIPRLKFSRKSFVDLFGFGWKMMVSDLLNTAWKELFVTVIGKFYSPATLGQYSRASQFSRLFSSNLTAVIQRVTYPVLSSIQEDKQRMVSAYRRIIKTTMFATACGSFFMGAMSEPMIFCLIGKKWYLAASYLPMICVNSSLYPLHAINLNMLQVQGRSDLFLGLEIVKKIIALVPLYIGAVYGIMPMLYTNFITGIIAFFLNSYFTGKFLNYSSWMQIKDILPSYGIACILALSVWFLKYLDISHWIILPMQIVVGCVVFLFVNEILKLEEYKELKNIVLKTIRKKHK